MVLWLIVSILTLPPIPAVRLVAPELEHVVRRESRGAIVGLHEVDARHGRAAWRNAVRVGLLDPEHCSYHEMGEPSQWSTSGPFGAMRAYSLHHLPVSCIPPWVLDIPVVAAFAARRRASAPACDRAPRCVSWRSRAESLSR